jgi:DNA-directed RNA polymerase subunit RPC12/RpoP
MTDENVIPKDLEWLCSRCSRDLKVGPVNVEYMGNRFETDLPRCPQCGLVLVSETVALGEMAEVEQILEDK